METKWDLSFACDVEVINKHILTTRISFLKTFIYHTNAGTISGTIPTWSIGWAGNEIYMAVDMQLADVKIRVGEVEKIYPSIRSIVNIQYAFQQNRAEELVFAVKREAISKDDSTFGAIWIENADVDKVITDDLLANAYPGLLKKALINHESDIDVVLASLKKDLLKVEGLSVVHYAPAFQKLNNKIIVAILCMVEKTSTVPTKQFDTDLLQNSDYGYILKKEIFMKHILQPKLPEMFEVKSGKFTCTPEGCIVNDGVLVLRSITVGAIDYEVKADYFTLQFIGDVLDLTINGKCDITGLTDSYVTYSYHAQRQGIYKNSESKIVFEKIRGIQDEFHSSRHIPLWVEIIAGITTLGLFTLITQIISDLIQERVEKFFRQFDFNGKMGGYGSIWNNIEMKFSNGGFKNNFYLQGKK